ncbi:MAG: prepilin-type N-terminal cleavage/methylation domain-containing protein [Terriglobales bacterium]
MRLKNGLRKRHTSASGFSLLEVMAVVAISLTVGTFAVLSLVPVMNQQHVTNAYNTTISAMRQARDNAISQRTSYSVTFSNSTVPNTIVVAPTLAGFQGDQNTATYQLPSDVTYKIQSVFASTTPPDNYGAGTSAIDFGYPAPQTGTGGQTSVYFCPDGSSQNATGAGSCSGMNYWSGGVIYLGRGTDVMSSRAITVWGGTGRIHGWRLYSNTSGVYSWLRN